MRTRPKEEVIQAMHRDITKDPREDEDWFLRMPAEERDEMRERWRADKTRFEPWRQRRREFRSRCLREGVFVCGAAVAPLMLTGTVQPVLVAIPVGLAIGWLWWWAGSGRLTSSIIASTAVLPICAFGGVWTGMAGPMGFLFTALAVLLAGSLASGLGLRRELDLREQV